VKIEVVQPPKKPGNVIFEAGQLSISQWQAQERMVAFGLHLTLAGTSPASLGYPKENSRSLMGPSFLKREIPNFARDSIVA